MSELEYTGLTNLGEKDLGLIGLGVMGQSLALNLQNHGYSVVVYNRTEQKTREFVSRHTEISAAYNLKEFTASIRQPRKVLLMLTAGSAVDATINGLGDLLARGDVLMDGGNSHFQDTERRCIDLEKRGVNYLGMGVSGGEEGALKGPCIMVGGPREGYDQVSEMLNKIAAKVDGPCCQHLGPRGAGHYVKMVHNGIEYAIIQIIAEAYDVLTRASGIKIKQVQTIFNKWNRAELNSFLMEIAAEVLAKYDSETKLPLVSLILDRAQQKGTGKWTSQNALDLGVPTPTIDAAVQARNLSALKDERISAAKILKRRAKPRSREGSLVQSLRGAVRASVIVSYAQGFHLMRAASEEYGYEIPFAEVARIWKGGCIIRAKLLDSITRTFRADESLSNLMTDPRLARELMSSEKSWRGAVKAAEEVAVPVPALSASLNYYDGYRSERLPANLIQALRDRFGAHGYERVDRPGHFHTDWSS
jgi:6-phosphogluconate dehydrogenase